VKYFENGRQKEDLQNSNPKKWLLYIINLSYFLAFK
jgi:hypothetical protein